MAVDPETAKAAGRVSARRLRRQAKSNRQHGIRIDLAFTRIRIGAQPKAGSYVGTPTVGIPCRWCVTDRRPPATQQGVLRDRYGRRYRALGNPGATTAGTPGMPGVAAPPCHAVQYAQRLQQRVRITIRPNVAQKAPSVRQRQRKRTSVQVALLPTRYTFSSATTLVHTEML